MRESTNLNMIIMDYKKIIKRQSTRFAILKAFNWVPDKWMLPIQYKIKIGRWPNLRNPQRWTEKLQIYKMFYRNPILHTCVDKYEVRKYIESKRLKELLVPLFGVWDNADYIDFDALPQAFILKTTDGGGGETVYIVKDKSKEDFDTIKKKLNSWLGRKNINAGREWAYTGIKKSQIIAEELLINKRNPEAGIEDFKILCFNGEPKYIIVDKDRYIDHKRNFYTTNWERRYVTTDHEQFEEEYPQPVNLDEMLQIAHELSKDFPFVRVDLYNVDGKIYFGELTFYPWTGYVQFDPDEFDFELGSYFTEY